MKPDDPAPSTLVPPPVKQTLRLDYDRFADSIRDKQLVEPAALKQVLDQSQSSGALFTDLLVRDGHLSDWEVSRLAAEVFGLAFLPTEFYEPNTELIECFDSTFLRHNILVPLDRFGDLITVSMPGMVPTEVLREIEEKLSVTVLPVVGSVSGNSAWLEANLPEAKMLKALASEVEAGDGWGELFDAGCWACFVCEHVEWCGEGSHAGAGRAFGAGAYCVGQAHWRAVGRGQRPAQREVVSCAVGFAVDGACR